MMATRDKKEKINRFIPLLLFLKSLFTNSENKNVTKFSHYPPPLDEFLYPRLILSNGI